MSDEVTHNKARRVNVSPAAFTDSTSHLPDQVDFLCYTLPWLNILEEGRLLERCKKENGGN